MYHYNTHKFDKLMLKFKNILNLWQTNLENVIPNYNQQDATFLNLFIYTDVLHVSGNSSAHHQEHITVHTASGIVNCNDRVKWIASKFVYKISRSFEILYTNLLDIHLTLSVQLTILEAVFTVMCSWWWEEEPRETCRTSVEINKSRNDVSCWL